MYTVDCWGYHGTALLDKAGNSVSLTLNPRGKDLQKEDTSQRAHDEELRRINVGAT